MNSYLTVSENRWERIPAEIGQEMLINLARAGAVDPVLPGKFYRACEAGSKSENLMARRIREVGYPLVWAVGIAFFVTLSQSMGPAIAGLVSLIPVAQCGLLVAFAEARYSRELTRKEVVKMISEMGVDLKKISLPEKKNVDVVRLRQDIDYLLKR